jgi:hypothetical protein
MVNFKLPSSTGAAAGFSTAPADWKTAWPAAPLTSAKVVARILPSTCLVLLRGTESTRETRGRRPGERTSP